MSDPTKFVLYSTTPDSEKVLAEPILASFPENMPKADTLKQMKFSIFQQEKKSQYQTKNRRVIKSERKNVKYTAENFGTNDIQDYYLGVISSKHEGKVYCMPVSTPYQFKQEIEGFKEIYGGEDNEAIKNMTYIEKKQLLVKNFGVLKAQRQTEQMISNNVKDEGVTNREGKGTRDTALLANAQSMDTQLKASAKNGEKSSVVKKKQMYSKDGLLPEDILNLIPYKQTYEALQKEDYDALSALLSSFVRVSMSSAYTRFEHIESKREKKNIMKSHVYLDALITLFRIKGN